MTDPLGLIGKTSPLSPTPPGGAPRPDQTGGPGFKELLQEQIAKVNEMQKELVIKKVTEMLWNLPDKTIGVWGLAFKPDTDDIRCAPSIDIIKRLLAEGADIKAFDPVAMENTKKELGDKIVYCRDIYEAAQDADCVILMTEWNEFKEIDWQRLKGIMRQPAILDGRNAYDPRKLKDMGFRYAGIGRS